MQAIASKVCDLQDLPPELQAMIFGSLEFEEADVVARVCADWRETVTELSLVGKGLSTKVLTIIRSTHPECSGGSNMKLLDIWPSYTHRQPFSFYLRGEESWTASSITTLIRLGTPVTTKTLQDAINFGGAEGSTMQLLLGAKTWSPDELSTPMESAFKQGKSEVAALLYRSNAKVPDRLKRNSEWQGFVEALSASSPTSLRKTSHSE